MANLRRVDLEPDPVVVETLREMLKQAEAGELIGLAAIGWTRGDHDPDLYVSGAFQPTAMLGALYQLQVLVHEVTR